MKNMVTDRYSTYFTLDSLDHQVRLTRLLRELEYLTELDKGQERSKHLQGCS